MKIIHGDLLRLANEGHFDIIVHGCNCFCAMGAGIALQIRNMFPGAYEADKMTDIIAPPIKKMGTYTKHTTDSGLVIINAYTQHFPGRNGNDLNDNYNAIRSCFKLLRDDSKNKRVGIPRIGAGLGGGNWVIISNIIEEEMKGIDLTLVEYAP